MKRAGAARLAVLLICLSGSLAASPSRGREGDGACTGILSRLFAPLPGGHYRLLVAGNGGSAHAVGTGELREDGRRGTIDFSFEASLPAHRSLHGRMRLSQGNGTCRMRLRWQSPERPGGAQGQTVDEQVEADAWLAAHGMLQFYFDGGKRFFQLDRKGNESRMVTEYGLLVLQPVP